MFTSPIWIPWELRKTTQKSEVCRLGFKMVVFTWRIPLLNSTSRIHCYLVVSVQVPAFRNFFLRKHVSSLTSGIIVSFCHITSQSQESCSTYDLQDRLFYFSVLGFMWSHVLHPFGLAFYCFSFFNVFRSFISFLFAGFQRTRKSSY